ncbi:hypothetical protein SARC_02122 [Sphaeroforma arctica JP610]|uniref:Prefoldin, alpha subunit n=1 Tax=Sphaeroforma arctica JP610 TaxID=667725 RepID=A0A0L0G9K8_9EUKA|nr:hypothetical protein SARC_02122 [Sphaeroforma arctica JP610]KNC85712.1 hypothetical protein SARC_02122 [Sphaeroforma arctica JP610]|eukprot:XP_014159614.1 hypothetical protein SARC_02122 [Sphaeroforma arctica JP610]
MTDRTISDKPAPGAREVDLNTLPVQALANLKEQTEEEIQYLAQSKSQLELAAKKFVVAKQAVASINPESSQAQVLVPMTKSLYVPGKLSNVEKVVVELGTGYYVEKSMVEAGKYYDRRLEYLQTNIQGIVNHLNSKQNVHVV